MVERLPDGRFRTQGDANAQPDSRLVGVGELIGAGRVVVPLAGLVRLHAGRFLPAVAGLALITGLLLHRRRRKPPGAEPPVVDEPPAANGTPPAKAKAPGRRATTPRPVRRKPRRSRSRTLVVTAVVLLTVGSALRDSSATFTAVSPTAANSWKTSYFYAGAIKKSNPVSYWRMGGTSSSAVADEMGRNPLALYNTPVVGAAGALTVDPDRSTTFKNGTGPSYGAITNAAYAISGPLTVAAWTNVQASTNWRLVFKGEAQTGRLNYLLSWSSDKGGSDMRFLVDAGGAQVSQLAASGSLAALPATPLQVSENNASTGLTGSVDEVAVWDSAVGAAQLARFYALAKQ